MISPETRRVFVELTSLLALLCLFALLLSSKTFAQDETDEEAEHPSPREALMSWKQSLASGSLENHSLPSIHLVTIEDAQLWSDLIVEQDNLEKWGREWSDSRIIGLLDNLEEIDDGAPLGLIQRTVYPHLEKIVNELLKLPSKELIARNDLTIGVLQAMLKIDQAPATGLVLQALTKEELSESFRWYSLLNSFDTVSPATEKLYNGLRRITPKGALSAKILEFANDLAMREYPERHLFDNDRGIAQLRTWLDSKSVDNTQAVNSAISLAFIAHPQRDELLNLALSHNDRDVVLEAAWASARLGQNLGIQRLRELCKDVISSSKAQDYLRELDHEDDIPQECGEAKFKALAEFSRWLSHPNELGRPPDKVELIDQRTIAWPLEDDPVTVSLVRYEMSDPEGIEPLDSDVGMVGPMTFCLFGYQMDQRPIEDCYAIHCAHEMAMYDQIEVLDIDADDHDYDYLKKTWKGEKIEELLVTGIAKLSASMKYPRRLVGIGTGKLKGEAGYVVFDGPRSTWYPLSEQPLDSGDTPVLYMHIGRQLLELKDKPDRKSLLKPTQESPPEDMLVKRVDALLTKIDSKDELQRNAALHDFALEYDLEDYVLAKSKIGNKDVSVVTIETYEHILRNTAALPEIPRCQLLLSRATLLRNLPMYARAKHRNQDTERAKKVFDLLTEWLPAGTNSFFLGQAAVAMEDWKSAQDYLQRPDAKLSDEPETDLLLAMVMHRLGKTSEAQELLRSKLIELQDYFPEEESAVESENKVEKPAPPIYAPLPLDVFVEVFGKEEGTKLWESDAVSK